jgi:hypothetical protein
MTQLRSAVAGDVGDTRLITLDGIDDLSTASSVEAHVWLPSGTKQTLTAAVTDPIERTVTVQLGLSGGWLPTATPGTWNFELEVTFPSAVLTWPNGKPDRIVVRAQGD